jgi:hypothetical protein
MMASFRTNSKLQSDLNKVTPADPPCAETRVRPPAPGGIITGAGLAGSQLQQVLRRRPPTPLGSSLSGAVLKAIRRYLDRS